jgi:hypothetical protein
MSEYVPSSDENGKGRGVPGIRGFDNALKDTAHGQQLASLHRTAVVLVGGLCLRGEGAGSLVCWRACRQAICTQKSYVAVSTECIQPSHML